MKLRKQIILLSIVVIVFLGAIIFAGTYLRKKPGFSYNKNLGKTALTIDDTTVTLGDFAYYVMDVENFINNQAIVYNPDNPKDYWDTHFSAGKDSTFIYIIAKKQAYQACVTDYLYAMEAENNDFSLTDTQKATTEREAEDMYDEMTEKQKSGTGLTLEVMTKMHVRAKLATEYASYIAENTDWSDTVLSPATELSYDGNYFQDNILNKYKIKKGKTWGNIRLGNISIN